MPTKETAQSLLAKADDILREVDESAIMKQMPRRDYPQLDRSEVTEGPLLGKGGFGIVYEVKEICLKNGECCTEKEVEETDEDKALALLTAQLGTDKHDADDTNVHDDHYDVEGARSFMAENVLRNGDARYAIKRLKKDLEPRERVRGMIDLAIEVKFLSVLWHPNIIKMRAVASGAPLNKSFFIVIDRLYDTLDKRIVTWLETYNANKGGLFGRGANKEELSKLMLQRLVVAYDLAAAFSYMHGHQLVYRDIKQENIAFDVRGDVKVFDFGLGKGLSKELQSARRNEYNLTPRTGSLPYMAPEIAECKPYGTKCDVFSFGMLLWEMMALKDAYPGISARQYMERLVMKDERPQINKQWTPLVRTLIKEAWGKDPETRPEMRRIATMLRADLKDITDDDSIVNRTTHMASRSKHSIRLHQRGLQLG